MKREFCRVLYKISWGVHMYAFWHYSICFRNHSSVFTCTLLLDYKLINIVYLMCISGIDTSLRDSKGRTALDILKEHPAPKAQQITALIQGETNPSLNLLTNWVITVAEKHTCNKYHTLKKRRQPILVYRLLMQTQWDWYKDLKIWSAAPAFGLFHTWFHMVSFCKQSYICSGTGAWWLDFTGWKWQFRLDIRSWSWVY